MDWAKAAISGHLEKSSAHADHLGGLVLGEHLVVGMIGVGLRSDDGGGAFV
jgi:hypothetical protein